MVTFLDLILFVWVAFWLFQGWRKGLFRTGAELIGLIFTIVLALQLARPFSVLIAGVVDSGLAYPISFLSLWLIFHLIWLLIIRLVETSLPQKVLGSEVNKVAGSLLAGLYGVTAIGLSLAIILALPVNNRFKSVITDSAVASQLIGRTARLTRFLESQIQRSVGQTLSYFTVRPLSQNSYEIKLKPGPLTVDLSSQKKMLELVNLERRKAGQRDLELDQDLTRLAQGQAQDMWLRRYFGHVNPDGQDPFARMDKAKISYQSAGENLALAPSVELAHLGLMDSSGHRANILNPGFGRVGIGVVDGGFGKIFVQEFTN